jgi:hypothetical protein
MKDKEFDCVEMKHQIQQELLKEMDGLSCEERRQKTERAIQSDSVLCRVWQRARRVDRRGASSTEPS